MALRAAVASARAALAGATPPSPGPSAEGITTQAAAALAAAERGSLRPVVNATGVVIHTNLGRAPLATAALDRLTEVARGYATLEYDLATGARGSRAAARRTSAHRADRRRSGGGRQQQRRRHAAGARRAGPRPRGAHLARGAGGNRRRLPGAGRDDAVGRAAARSGHHQPHAPLGLHRRHGPGHGAGVARASVQLPHRGLHRTAGTGRRRRRRTRRGRRRGRRPRVGQSRSALAVGAHRAGVTRRRRGSGGGERRQDAGRTAGRHHPREEGAGRTPARASADAGPAGGQADLRRARGHAARTSRRTRRTTRCRCCGCCTRRRRRWRRGHGPWPTPCTAAAGRPPSWTASRRSAAAAPPVSRCRPHSCAWPGQAGAPTGSKRGCARSTRPSSREFRTARVVLDLRTVDDGRRRRPASATSR